MTNEDSISVLKKFVKYERGRGRKYPMIGCPVEREPLCDALDVAIKYLKAITTIAK